MSGSWIEDAPHEAARLLGLTGPLVLPAPLLELFAAETGLLALDAEMLPTGVYANPAPQFGVLGQDMPAYFVDYEFAEYMPGAWPIALDGAGGFYALDTRALAGSDDGRIPLVWSHGGNLGWGQGEHVAIADDAAEFLRAAIARTQY